MYVSYRLNNKVYWTANKARIPEGEMLVTDGDCEARARCGNRVSASPQQPVAGEEPMIETFDFPQFVSLIPPPLTSLPGIGLQWNALPPMAMNTVPSLGRVLNPKQPNDIAPDYLHPPVSSDPSDIVVPEPALLTLLLTGLTALLAFRFFHKK